MLTLYYRVVESGHADPIIQDPIAADLLTRIDFDFVPIAGRKFDRVVAMLRAGSV